MARPNLSPVRQSAFEGIRKIPRHLSASVYSTSSFAERVLPGQYVHSTTPGSTLTQSSDTSGCSATPWPPRPQLPRASRRTTVSSRLHLLIDLLYQRLYQFHGLFHRCAHRIAQLHQHVFVVFSAHDHLRLAAHHEDAGWPGAQSAGECDHLTGSIPCVSSTTSPFSSISGSRR